MKQTTLKNSIKLIKYHVNGITIVETVIWTFNDTRSVIEHWPLLKKFDIGPKHKVMTRSWSWSTLNPVYRYYSYTLRDSLGNYVDVLDIQNQYNTQHPKYFKYNRFSGKKCSAGRHYYRRVRNLNERKQTEEWKVDHRAPKPRARRNLRNLPDTWDDYRVASREDRNWKNFRKTQWK